MIHKKYQTIFSKEVIFKKFKMLSVADVNAALRVTVNRYISDSSLSCRLSLPIQRETIPVLQERIYIVYDTHLR